MSVKVTFEFENAEAAIVALGKIAGVAPVAAPAAPVEKTRKSRADAGQPRGPNARTTGGTETKPPEAGAQGANPGGAPAGSPAASGGAVSEKPAEAPAPQTQTPPPAATAATPEQVQAAVEKLFNAKGFEDCAAVLSRFGVKRGKDLLPEQRGEFIAKVDRVIAGEAI